MSSVKTQSRYDASRHMNYISTAPFNTVFFTYSTSMNGSFQTIGALTAVTGATAANCPAGRILRANNKKLYPDAAGLDATTYPDRTPLVGVFDYHSGLSGFIDPNNSVFALYNGDKPVDTIDGTASSGANNHKGMSVYTGGNVTASGNVKVGTQLTLASGSPAINYVATNTPYDFTQTGAVFVGGVTATTLTVTSVTSGTITIGSNFTVATVAYTVTALGTGTGGTGTYTVSNPTTANFAAGTTVTITSQVAAFYTFVNAGVVNLLVGTLAGVPVSGTQISVLFTGTATVTLTTRISPVTTVAVSGTTGIVVNFVSNGSSLVELSRSGSYTTAPTFPVAS